MQRSVVFKCKISYYDYIIKKIIQNDIDIIRTNFKDNYCFITCYEDEYIKLLKFDYKKIIIFVHYTGLYNILNFVKNNILYFIITTIIIVFLFISNIFVFDINIHTNDINLDKKIKYFLVNENLKLFSPKKSYKDINIIKEKLLNKYKNEIEWIEITPNGYKYDVYVIKRKQNEFETNNDRCNYVAKKSGTITRIKVENGVLLVQENNYINQGEILISGDIIYNDELKSTTCAKGKIYGEVWYEVDVAYPLIKKKSKFIKPSFFNVSINILGNKYYIFKNKYENIKKEKKIGNKYIGLNMIVLSKNKVITKKISEKKGEELALKKAMKSINTKLKNNSKILSQNILKKYVKNDTIYLKVLMTVEEELGVVESY